MTRKIDLLNDSEIVNLRTSQLRSPVKPLNELDVRVRSVDLHVETIHQGFASLKLTGQQF